jgi:hypothetical protein
LAIAGESGSPGGLGSLEPPLTDHGSSSTLGARDIDDWDALAF